MLPEQFTKRMKQMLGEEYEAFLQSFEGAQVQSLRINTLKGTKEQYDRSSVFFNQELLKEKVAWTSDGYYYEEALKPGKHPFHEAGVYYIQEASAMAPAAICAAVKPFADGERVLDLCAAPGGKSTQIAAAMQGKGILFSNEIHPARAKILSENMERMGITNALVLNHDPNVLAERFPEYFHRILVDAPCSGEGMFHKNAEAVEQWSEENVTMCAQRQEEILEAAYRMLMPGGVLVYSTCTFAPQEDEGMISSFLHKHEDMKLLQIPLMGGMVPGQNFGQEDTVLDIDKTARLWPHQLKGEGHFAALLKKDGEGIWAEGQAVPDRKLSKEMLKTFMEFQAQTMQKGWSEEQKGSYLMFGEQLYLTPVGTPDLTGLRVLRPGLHLGTFKKNRFEPSHALALSLHKEDVKETIDLSVEDAIKYIQGDTFPVKDQKGWCLVTVEGYSIGFGKAAGGILKNHYPKGLRKVW